METNNQPTVMTILTDVVKMLGDIEVPAAKVEQIGIPIAKCINGIKLCIDAINQAEHQAALEKEKEKEQDEAANEPEIQIVETGYIDKEDVDA